MIEFYVVEIVPNFTPIPWDSYCNPSTPFSTHADAENYINTNKSLMNRQRLIVQFENGKGIIKFFEPK